VFTGLIETTGSIVRLDRADGPARLTVALPPAMASRLHTGDSIAVSGVCLTALDVDPARGRFSADLAAETLARTSLGHLAPGSTVNLELPTPAGTPLGGHVVQGHVDGVGTLLEAIPLVPDNLAATDWRLALEIPPALTRYVAEKGSIAVEGISLTVARLDGRRVEIALIPHTWAATNLHGLRAGSPLNIEVDVLAKYAERRADEGRFQLSLEYLVANGF
jgi:riboflavin synthase